MFTNARFLLLITVVCLCLSQAIFDIRRTMFLMTSCKTGKREKKSYKNGLGYRDLSYKRERFWMAPELCGCRFEFYSWIFKNLWILSRSFLQDYFCLGALSMTA